MTVFSYLQAATNGSAVYDGPDKVTDKSDPNSFYNDGYEGDNNNTDLEGMYEQGK